MKQGAKWATRAAGFTIVEVMIVLAVTGLLFVIIVASWSSRQHVNEFITSAQEVRSRLQQVISDVQNGYYTNAGNLQCTANGGTLSLTVPSGTPPARGTNQGCVFLGKVIQFGISSGTSNESYAVYSIAGLQSATSLATADPTAIAPSNAATTIPNESETGTLDYGLTTVAMQSGGQNVGAVGFLTGLGTVSAGSYANGIQPIDTYAVSHLGIDSPTAAGNISTGLASAVVVMDKPVYICFKGGDTNQYALITIGGEGGSGQLSVELQTLDGSQTNCGLN